MPGSRFTLTRLQLRWAALLALSILLAALFEAFGLPAGRLLGPMVAAIVLAVLGRDVAVARPAFLAAQGIVGCLLARGIPSSIGSMLAAHWPVFLAGVLAVTVLANGLGWLLSRWNVFPGDTAIWGCAPGAAAAMMIMAEAHGADVRLVAFMQYLRVVCVTFAASLVAHWWIRDTAPAAAEAAAAAHAILLGPASWSGLALTLAVACAGVFVGYRLRLPAGTLLVPMVFGMVLQDVLHVPLELPPLLLAAAYAVMGWTIGMRFNGAALVAAARSLPKMLASTFALIALCGGVGVLLVEWAHVDPLTAYFATSPGGADSVAIIAAASPVDMPFVITMQVLRMLFVMVTGPAIARLLARHLGKPAAH